MAKPSVFVVDSIASYTEKVEQLLIATLASQMGSPYQGNWYRGVGRANLHTLGPSLYRHPTILDVEGLIKLERLMLEDFARQNFLHASALHAPAEADDFRSLFFMQHYGVPTRLLDWTNNPLIALYFALSSAERVPGKDDYVEDASVWILDPVLWNEHALSEVSYGKEGPLSLESEEAKAYGPRRLIKGRLEASAVKSLYEHPVAILGVANNARMFAQRGVFTMFGKMREPMEVQYDTHNFSTGSLAQLIIPKEKIGELSERLLRLGYTDSVSYPDLHGLAMEIKRSRGFRI